MIRTSPTAVAVLLIALAVPASAQSFIQIPGVKGYSTHVSHQGWSELGSYELAIAPPVAEKGNQVTNRCSAALTGRLGAAVPSALQLIGVPIAGEVVIEKVAPGTGLVFERSIFTGVEITAVQIDREGAEPLENIAMNFAAVKLEYKEQKEDGTLGGTVAGSYDCTQVK